MDQFTEDKVADPERMALAERVSVKEAPEITKKGGKFRQMVRVQIELEDGRTLEKTVAEPRGSENSFASDTDIVSKFQKLAGHVLSRAQVERIRDQVMKLETMDNVTRLVRSLRTA